MTYFAICISEQSLSKIVASLVIILCSFFHNCNGKITTPSL